MPLDDFNDMARNTRIEAEQAAERNKTSVGITAKPVAPVPELKLPEQTNTIDPSIYIIQPGQAQDISPTLIKTLNRQFQSHDSPVMHDDVSGIPSSDLINPVTGQPFPQNQMNIHGKYDGRDVKPSTGGVGQVPNSQAYEQRHTFAEADHNGVRIGKEIKRIPGHKNDIVFSAEPVLGIPTLRMHVQPHVEDTNKQEVTSDKPLHDIEIISGKIDGKPVHNVHIQAEIKPKTAYVGPSGDITKSNSAVFETARLPDGKPYTTFSVNGEYDLHDSLNRKPTKEQQEKMDLLDGIRAEPTKTHSENEIDVPTFSQTHSLGGISLKKHSNSTGATKMESFADIHLDGAKPHLDDLSKKLDINLDSVKPHLDTLAKKLLPSESLQQLPADFRTEAPKQR